MFKFDSTETYSSSFKLKIKCTTPGTKCKHLHCFAINKSSESQLRKNCTLQMHVQSNQWQMLVVLLWDSLKDHCPMLIKTDHGYWFSMYVHPELNCWQFKGPCENPLHLELWIRTWTSFLKRRAKVGLINSDNFHLILPRKRVAYRILTFHVSPPYIPKRRTKNWGRSHLASIRWIRIEEPDGPRDQSKNESKYLTAVSY